ncbi:phosphoenolpyruvate carboxylase [Azospirillum sp. RWY-5-1]|uniref:Phosphoenolpyruvate carboxylase n=1 Tax=Azospirillum oleiclasticum TaxID=2735135 RepID=A0ABX2T4C6_9PROT|nr:phosphoenolpyruvate carboxylase [Azospirillum oleiclasticum]NYZ10964.1 phosphoenolpyruvate carboxylase [Azospirillum oleiclasticum]NYZ18126.1 phosphoenolpyruvate carboxylase [Azospirillum oleiclasticum]
MTDVDSKPARSIRSRRAAGETVTTTDSGAEMATTEDHGPKPALTTNRPLLKAPLARFEAPTALDCAALAADLAGCLDRFAQGSEEDPFSNPVLHLALEITRRLEAGALDHGSLEQLIQYLSAEGLVDRATRLGRWLGEIDPAANEERLRALLRAVALPEGASEPVPFDDFRATVEREIFGMVMTAHPTFNLSGQIMTWLTMLATGRHVDGRPLGEEERADVLRRMAQSEHRPDTDISLAREHQLSLAAIANIQAALRRVYALVYQVAAEVYPERWSDVTPRLITVASWVGYDLDGRSDIKWTDTLHKRLKVESQQLRHYIDEIKAVRSQSPDDEELRHTLEQVESRLALAIHEVSDEIAVFSDHDPDSPDAYRQIQRISKRMHEGQPYRLVDAAFLVERVNRAIRLLCPTGQNCGITVLRLCVLRAELASFGLGMAHTHVRINSTQLHNAIRKAVALETAPDDPRYRQSYIERITQLLDTVEPVTVNFGSLITERTSAKRLFMVVAQMLKYSDASTPVRFLIAESEAAFTMLTALYYARLFGIEDRLDISPLFETERALEVGSRVIDALLENPHYRAYVEKRGRLCIQTGYSDAGRYLGQTPAAASIERLRNRIARLFRKHDLKNVQLVVFDTHGDSIGRGAHPASYAERLSYTAPPAWLQTLAESGIPFKQEVSFQGGDGFTPFMTQPGAFAIVTRILEYMMGPRANGTGDPFYDENDYITEFFTTVKEFQVSLVRDPNYAVLVSAFGANLLYPSGSRATKRQYDGAANIDQQNVSQIRAIPHNAILQQLGLPANTIGGVGAAVAKDPERYALLYQRSARFRQLLGMVEYGAAIADPDALKAYIDMLDPGLWLTLAARAGERARADEMRVLADHLEENPAHVRQIRIFRKLFRDFTILRSALERTGPGCGDAVSQRTQVGLRILHAVRLALIHEIYRMATHVPDFSSQHQTTRDQLIARILHLDIPTAVAQLKVIFPATPESPLVGDFGETATYVSDESQNYRMENERLFRPMTGLYELIARTSSAVTQRIGFFG